MEGSVVVAGCFIRWCLRRETWVVGTGRIEVESMVEEETGRLSLM